MARACGSYPCHWFKSIVAVITKRTENVCSLCCDYIHWSREEHRPFTAVTGFESPWVTQKRDATYSKNVVTSLFIGLYESGSEPN